MPCSSRHSSQHHKAVGGRDVPGCNAAHQTSRAGPRTCQNQSLVGILGVSFPSLLVFNWQTPLNSPQAQAAYGYGISMQQLQHRAAVSPPADLSATLDQRLCKSLLAS